MCRPGGENRAPRQPDSGRLCHNDRAERSYLAIPYRQGLGDIRASRFVPVAEPEYLERFGYMFTLGSALYQAEIRGRLNEDNAEAYGALDDYNSLLADYTDRF